MKPRLSPYFTSLAIILIAATQSLSAELPDATPRHRGPAAAYRTTLSLWELNGRSRVTPQRMYDAIFSIIYAGDGAWGEVAAVAAARKYPTEPRFGVIHIAIKLADGGREREAMAPEAARLLRLGVPAEYREPLVVIGGPQTFEQAMQKRLAALPKEAEKAPDDVLLCWLTAEVERAFGKPELAIPLFEKASKHLHPGPASLHRSYAFALNNFQRRGDELEHARLAAELEPTGWGYYNLGNVLESLRRWDDAIEAYQQAGAVSPDGSWMYQGLQSVETQRGNKQKADEYAKKLDEAVAARAKEDE